MIEWPEGDAEPAKYWLATLPPDMPFDRLVDLAKCAGGSNAIIRS